MSKRYASSMEASWRIFQFPTVAVKPAIICLPIHLENQQCILYDPTNPVQAQQALENGKRTMLTEFFQANVEYLEAQTVLYCNFPMPAELVLDWWDHTKCIADFPDE